MCTASASTPVEQKPILTESIHGRADLALANFLLFQL